MRLSATAQLAALGLCTGEVALHRLWGSPGMEPLRTISLAEWGYEPEAVGSVADLQWAPDGRALAVSLSTYLPANATAGVLECCNNIGLTAAHTKRMH